jgi:hypothetical protein
MKVFAPHLWHSASGISIASVTSQAMRLVARSHQSLIWDRGRHVQRLRSALREYFPAALAAFEDLHAPDALELLGQRRIRIGPRGCLRPRSARRCSARTAARSPSGPGRSRPRCRAPGLRQPLAVQAAFAGIAVGEIRVITTLNAQIAALGEVVAEHFGRHPDAEIYASQPGLGVCSAPGSSASSAMHRAATLTRELARTTPAPHRSPASRVPRKWSSPATPETAGSPTPCRSGPWSH